MSLEGLPKKIEPAEEIVTPLNPPEETPKELKAKLREAVEGILAKEGDGDRAGGP